VDRATRRTARRLTLAFLLLAACAAEDTGVRHVYGAWRLDREVRGTHAGAPDFVQFAPGGEVLLAREGGTLERRRFSFRHGVPVADTAERFMLVIEGEPDNWIVSRPNRGTLIIQPNNLEDPPRTYRRER
jgi:hypothetical protein